jgi:hypothetical protein
MAKYEFVATHGVEFGEHPKFKDLANPGPFVVWAKFERDRSLDTPEGEKRYTFSTDDAAVAARLRTVNDFGIDEVSKPAPAPVNDQSAS